ncbi:metallophosphoesterase family protein [Mesorhizobium dulcispinae]|uniref:metallophosphoesterase family protein n=1 Tax=Mesorhizobium dulcispinae TaxID=3072316 RepID=UPI002A23D480|nr:metallophosphoesterase [Mesorhizobium sp. VK23D]MDX8521764.1 metallophosphoesterase [Mesorhizobium sp. VK23D]
MTASSFIAFISDPHLSEERPFFQFNWEILVDELSQRRPDLVLVGGDLALDGANNPSDLWFARRQLERLGCPWLAVPGNHDVGDLTKAATSEAAVTEERRNRYLETIGRDFWSFDIGDWRIIGLNSMILTSGFAAEAEQERFLARSIGEAGSRQVALLSHMAVCDAALSEVDTTGWFVPSESRDMLGAYFRAGKIQLCLSGDMHQSRDRTIEGIRHVWAPSTAFVTDMREEWRPKFGGRKRVGWTEVRLGKDIEVTMHEPRRMVDFDIGNWVHDGTGLYYEFACGSRFAGFGTAAKQIAP